jgi:hypothetical protein
MTDYRSLYTTTSRVMVAVRVREAMDLARDGCSTLSCFLSQKTSAGAWRART